MIEFVYLTAFFTVLFFIVLMFQNWQKRNNLGMESARADNHVLLGVGLPELQ